MDLSRRRLFRYAGAAAVPLLPGAVAAQNYPTRPVHLVVTVPAGGSPDIVARLLGQWLSDRLAQPFVVENRPGAGGMVSAFSRADCSINTRTKQTSSGATASRWH